MLSTTDTDHADAGTDTERRADTDSTESTSTIPASDTRPTPAQVYRPRCAVGPSRRTSHLRWGTIVTDSEQDNGSEFIVVSTPYKQAYEWNVRSRGCTVAEDNPSYPPDVPVVVVLPVAVQRREFPFYSGFGSLSLSDMASNGVPFYAFPEPRLHVVRQRKPPQIPIENIRPSPCHVRDFNPAANPGFIADIRQQGVPFGFPKVRPVDYDGDQPAAPVEEPAAIDDTPAEPPRGAVVSETEFEVIDGHKRVWAARQAGLNTIPANVWTIDEKQAIEQWAVYHYDDYTPGQQRAVVDRLRERFDADPWDMFRGITPPEYTHTPPRAIK